MTVAEFLAWEITQEEKHEFVDGEIIAFAGGTNRHALIAARLIGLAGAALSGRCRVYGSDARVVTQTRSRYPDVVICCGQPDPPDATFLSEPTVIVEVLSETTHIVDREVKFDEYRTIDSVQEYVLVDSRERWAQTVLRTGERWAVSLPIRSGKLRFESLDVEFGFDDVYAGSGL